jgi:predicted P-loop ATPase
LKKSSNKKVDVALVMWFDQDQVEGTMVSGPKCAQKAKFLHEVLGTKRYVQSLCCMPDQTEVTIIYQQIAVQGKRISSNNATPSTFHKELKKFIQEENLKFYHIYNSSGSGL